MGGIMDTLSFVFHLSYEYQLVPRSFPPILGPTCQLFRSAAHPGHVASLQTLPLPLPLPPMVNSAVLNRGYTQIPLFSFCIGTGPA